VLRLFLKKVVHLIKTTDGRNYFYILTTGISKFSLISLLDIDLSYVIAFHVGFLQVKNAEQDE
jgi:hypothetical protein